MGKYQTPVIIESFTPLWWQCTLAVVATILLFVQIPKYWKKISPKKMGVFIAILLAINTVAEQVYNYQAGFWNLRQSLPGHLCSISNLLCIALLLNYKQWLAECVYYWGLAGGIHAILTPEFTMGMEGYNFISYFIGHGGLLLVVAYIIMHYQFKPRKNSWLKVLGYTQIVAIGIGILNYAVDANYMFLSAKPDVNNPFVIGEWPYYILIFELVALFHFWVFYLPFAKRNQKEKVQSTSVG